MVRQNQVIRKIENEIEFFTIEKTGESGLSISGLAIVCGVSHTAVSQILSKSVASKSSFKSLEPLHGRAFELQLNSEYKNATIVCDWACRCVIEYFAFDARKATKNARDSARAFMQAGIRTWIHGVTGWKPQPISEVNPIAFLTASVIREPKKWERHFSPEWIREAERLTGWDWNWGCMGQFIRRSIYDTLPLDFQERLDEVNPVGGNGKRARKQFQHVNTTVDEKVLKQLIGETLGMMRGSLSEQDYWRSHQNAYGKGFQLTLTFSGKSND
jgi:hypothetical protein